MKISQNRQRSHVILRKVIINQEEIRTGNIYDTNVGATSLIKQTLLKLKAKIGPNTIIVVDFNILIHK